MLPISQIAKKYGLSRSTLLYYDRLGLVRPSYRTGAGYRLYQAEDERRLERICLYRKAGIPLRDIEQILDPDLSPKSQVDAALHKRLTDLNGEIAALRRQQQIVISLLRPGPHGRLARAMTKEKWVALLRSVGLSDEEMMRWHEAFEQQTPEAHQDFLESLGLPADEIRHIRARAAAGGRKNAVGKLRLGKRRSEA